MKISHLMGWIVLGCLGLPPNNGVASPHPADFPPAVERQVLIPAGSYEMGSRRSLRELHPTTIFQTDRHMLGPEDPAHEVILDDFTIDKSEVTHLEYKIYMDTTGYKTLPRFWDHPDYNHPDQPVVGVTWKEAQQYCRWRNQRLPTEAEWEKAGRGKRPVKYPWGNEAPDGTRLNYQNEVGKPSPVGYFEAGKSDYEVYDLSGNLSEWVQDWHDPEHYLFSPKKNPQGPKKGQYRVIRGGNWMNNAEDVRLTYRNATVPKARSRTLGFRCVAAVK